VNFVPSNGEFRELFEGGKVRNKEGRNYGVALSKPCKGEFRSRGYLGKMKKGGADDFTVILSWGP